MKEFEARSGYCSTRDEDLLFSLVIDDRHAIVLIVVCHFSHSSRESATQAFYNLMTITNFLVN